MPLSRFVRAHVLPALRQVRGAVVLAVLLLFLSTASYVAAVEAMREVLEVLRAGDVEDARSPFLQLLRDAGVRERTTLFVAINATALLLPLVTYTLIFLRDIVFEVVSVRITQVLRDRLFERILRLPYLSLVATDPGTLVKRVAYDAANVRTLIVQGGLRRIADLSIALGLLAYMFTLDAALAVVALLVVLAYFGGAFWSAGLAKGSLEAMDQRLDALVRGAQEAFTRATDIRANARETEEGEGFAKLVQADADENVRGSRVLMVDRSFTGFLAAIGPVIVTLAGGLFVLGDSLELETLLAFTAATSMLYGPVNELSALPIIYQRTAVAMNNVGAILDAPPEGAGEPPGDTLEVEGGLRIAVRGLRFTYPGSTRAVVIDSLEVAPGERVAIVGKSGSGKSTLLRILFRLLDDYDGEVSIDGRDVREWSRDSLRRHIAFLTQEAQLFTGTIRANIAYGARHPDAVDEAELWSAAERARVEADIAAMSAKLDTELLVGAANLSGGQRRRLTLARALVKRPALLLLDEPLTGVAPKDRREVVAALTREDLACSVLLVTHQHDLLAQMDKVVWMDVDDAPDERGALITRVRAIGTHAALLSDAAYHAAFGDAPAQEQDHAS